MQLATHLKSLPKAIALIGFFGLLTATGAFAQKTQLLVYTALETDQIKAYQEGFNKVYPDIEIKWVRDSTGVITAKLLAEKSNPQADTIMGVAASSLALLDKQGMLEPYAPINLDGIMSQYRDKKKVPAWFGMDVWGATVCFNTVEAKKKNIPTPETWQDLARSRLLAVSLFRCFTVSLFGTHSPLASCHKLLARPARPAPATCLRRTEWR
jgi:iron(III) transport system substrate-binding protein